MKRDPLPEFRRAVRFIDLELEDAAIAAALDACCFERLQAREQEQRFKETSRHAQAFFRRGQTGEGLACLTAAQRAPLEAMKARVEALIAARGLAT